MDLNQFSLWCGVFLAIQSYYSLFLFLSQFQKKVKSIMFVLITNKSTCIYVIAALYEVKFFFTSSTNAHINIV